MIYNDEELEQCLQDGLELEPDEAIYWLHKYPENYMHYMDRFPYLRKYVIQVKVKHERKPYPEYLTPQIVEQVARSCTNRREFIREHSGAYEYAKRHGIDVSQWLPTKSQKRLAEVRGLIALVGVENLNARDRQWWRNHKEMFEKV